MYSYILEQEDGIYRYIFTTKNNLKYSVYFIAASEYFGLTELPVNFKSYGYTFGITKMEPDEEKPGALDPGIKHTVGLIVKDFISILPNAVLMINYDDHDSKDHKRFLCFDRWFNDLNSSGTFYKEDTEIILPTLSFQISIVVQSSNPHIGDILQEFYEIKTKLIEEK